MQNVSNNDFKEALAWLIERGHVARINGKPPRILAMERRTE